YINKLLINKFNFTETESKQNLNQAISNSEERVEIFSQIKIILNEMDHKERIDVIEMMWGVILSDGVVDDFEANLMRRMNGLLYISGIESAEAKERAMNQTK
ncbi:TerB family tellurite resistance protein, partial [Alphaproteobacteria bacterium]|nr:TerB family tellurite resistance protein [Alphaproteobacteria bacterium]